jgi:hypothetical protein
MQFCWCQKGFWFKVHAGETMRDLAGKTAFITGGASGIGLGMADM